VEAEAEEAPAPAVDEEEWVFDAYASTWKPKIVTDDLALCRKTFKHAVEDRWRVVTIDPNRSNVCMVMARQPTKAETESGAADTSLDVLKRCEFFSVLQENFWRASGGPTASSQAARRLTEKGILEGLKQLPARSPGTAAEAKARLRARGSLVGAWLEAHRPRAARRRRMFDHGRRRRLVNQVCDEIIYDPQMTPTQRKDFRAAGKRTVVVFGAALDSCLHGKGYRKGPLLELVRRLEERDDAMVVFVDEYHTSKLCFRCKQPLKQARGHKRKDDPTKDKKKELWGFKVCGTCEVPVEDPADPTKTQEVPLRMNRDVGACVNLFSVWVSLACKGRRPEGFKPPPKPNR
jgi:hypothetical protein